MIWHLTTQESFTAWLGICFDLVQYYTILTIIATLLLLLTCWVVPLSISEKSNVGKCKIGYLLNCITFFDKEDSICCTIQNKDSKNFHRIFSFCQSANILQNLVTLIVAKSSQRSLLKWGYPSLFCLFSVFFKQKFYRKTASVSGIRTIIIRE